jgi:hypothetical protein
LIADAFIQVQDADPYKDGRIRNGYSCGELLLAQPNQSPNCLQPRLPGFWNNARNSWSQDEYCAGTDCGNMAWVGIALLDFCEKNGENRESIYFQALARICQWIYNYTYCTGGLGGYRGGVSQVEKSPEYPDGQAWIPWKSCEHNIDIFVLFSRFARLSREEVWAQRANHAKEFVVNMRDPEDQHLFTGTLPDDTINKSVRPLDVNPWALMAFEDPAVFGPSVISAATHSALSVPVRGATATGFDFNDDLDGIWWEGTAQMALAFRMLVDVKRSEELLQSIRMFGGSPSYPGAIMAATKDGLTTGFLRPDKTPWLYWARPHIGGATCWYIFSELKWNPYWGKPLEPLNLYQTPSLK